MEKAIDLIDLARRLNGIPKDEPDGSCWVCGGSGGGYPPFQCFSCGGSGRSRVHDQELIDRRNEEIRDMKIDDELLREGK